MSTRATHNYGKPLNNIPRLSTDKPQSNEVITYHMEPKDMEAYLIEKYGIRKLRDSMTTSANTNHRPLSDQLIEYHLRKREERKRG